MSGGPVVHGDTLPGWFGKLPGMGDFASRRLPADVVAAWDSWLQAGLLGLRALQPDWVAHYLQSPVWRFALGPGVLDQRCWQGVLMPSVDAVGRYFPLTILAPWPTRQGVQASVPLHDALHWWARYAAAALLALEGDMDAARFDRALADAGDDDVGHDEIGADGPATGLTPPADGLSLWLDAPDYAAEDWVGIRGLPTGSAFARLFGIGPTCESLAAGNPSNGSTAW